MRHVNLIFQYDIHKILFSRPNRTSERSSYLLVSLGFDTNILLKKCQNQKSHLIFGNYSKDLQWCGISMHGGSARLEFDIQFLTLLDFLPERYDKTYLYLLVYLAEFNAHYLLHIIKT